MDAIMAGIGVRALVSYRLMVGTATFAAVAKSVCVQLSKDLAARI
jgi:hypothetical protein